MIPSFLEEKARVVFFVEEKVRVARGAQVKKMTDSSLSGNYDL